MYYEFSSPGELLSDGRIYNHIHEWVNCQQVFLLDQHYKNIRAD